MTTNQNQNEKTPQSNSDEFITLAPGPTGGLTLPIEVIRLACSLEERSFVLSQHGESLRVQGPNGTKPDLTPEETILIKRYKGHLLALLTYQAPEVM